jgi:hypothetical protein
VVGLVSNGSTLIIAERTTDRIPETLLLTTNRMHDAA